MRIVVALVALLLMAACSESPMIDSPVAPSGVEYASRLASNGVSCSDEAPRWLTGNLSTERRAATLPYSSNASVVEVDVHYHRDSDVGVARHIYTGRHDTTPVSEFRLTDSEGGGRYFVRLRSVDCDGAGQWSAWLTVYFGGHDTDPDGSVFPPHVCEYVPE